MRGGPLRVLAIAGLLMAGVACTPESDAVDLEDWCPTFGGNSLPTCSSLHDNDPALRLPSNEQVGVVTRGGAMLMTSAGSLPLDLGPEAIDAGISGSGRAQYATSLYIATIKNGTVTAMTRVAAVEEDAVLTSVLGGKAMEGTIGQHLGPDSYSFDETLPVRIELADTAADGKLMGRITNAEASVSAADGSCLPALSASPGNPLVDNLYAADVWLTRAPSMHVAFDDELVLHWNETFTGMGTGFYPSLATLTGADPLADTWDVVLHGNPLYGPSLSLRLVEGGGGSC